MCILYLYLYIQIYAIYNYMNKAILTIYFIQDPLSPKIKIQNRSIIYKA